MSVELDCIGYMERIYLAPKGVRGHAEQEK